MLTFSRKKKTNLTDEKRLVAIQIDFKTYEKIEHDLKVAG